MIKVKGLLGVAISILGAVGAITNVRAAKDKQDKLVLANAGASALAATTGVLLALRSLRKEGGK
ncbi:MAG: hypothetical protein JWQ81_6968 [Amycolatopsis sp.]|jgi:hypothetical protein|uniref:hypothetical protein n=1 Tax=Amycolatopsis sp. TaxID=37632 RepID=UPI002615F5BA|nr:hypothetical protein [Amycolatopsis sp.]MCU1686229.1 hypothetical protein [Amycolatopsis sp.]